MFSREEFMRDLEQVVNMDSGSFCLDGVRAVNALFARRFEESGWKIRWHEHREGPLSNSFYAYQGEEDAHRDLLVLCHTDTVFAEGEAAKRPFAVSADGSRVTGPGVADMKSGCLFALYAARILGSDPALRGRLAFFFNGQHEEGGSIGTRGLIEDYSRKSAFVIATEPVRANGSYLNRRKGIGRYTITFHGLSAHAGVNPQDGQCAITEMAHWILYCASLNDYPRGVSVNCGVVTGGTVPNAVADFAQLKIDVRANEYDDAKRIEARIFDKLNHKANKAIDVRIAGRITRPPMTPTPESLAACEAITALGKKRGIEVIWGSSGGGSDASFASGVGKPVLDGLTAVGGGMHTDKEYLVVSDIDRRFALFLDIVNLFLQPS